jgi:hypothetical protein
MNCLTKKIRSEKKLKIKNLLIYIYIYNTRILCVCVWHSIGSAPGRDTDLRPVSLEPAWPEPAILGKNFPEKWPVAKSRGKKFTTVMLFYGKNLAHFLFHIWKAFSLKILNNLLSI